MIVRNRPPAPSRGAALLLAVGVLVAAGAVGGTLLGSRPGGDGPAAAPVQAAAQRYPGYVAGPPRPTYAAWVGPVPTAAPAALPASTTVTAGGPGIPAVMLAAYQLAAARAAGTFPSCHLTWPVLAAIGRIESGHAAGGRVDVTGRTLGRIRGVALDGSPGVAAIRDTDRGVLDGDVVWDRAVGPMQFIPSTWRARGLDGNGDGVADPNNINDAAATTAAYLCAGGRDLSTYAGLAAAILSYNNSAAYLNNVLAWAAAYAAGVTTTASLPGPVPAAPVPAPTSPAALVPPPASAQQAPVPPATAATTAPAATVAPTATGTPATGSAATGSTAPTTASPTPTPLPVLPTTLPPPAAVGLPPAAAPTVAVAVPGTVCLVTVLVGECPSVAVQVVPGG